WSSGRCLWPVLGRALAAGRALVTRRALVTGRALAAQRVLIARGRGRRLLGGIDVALAGLRVAPPADRGGDEPGESLGRAHEARSLGTGPAACAMSWS